MKTTEIYSLEGLGFKHFDSLPDNYKDIFIRYFYDDVDNVYVKYNKKKELFLFVDVVNDELHILRVILNRDYSIEYCGDDVCIEQIDVATTMLVL